MMLKVGVRGLQENNIPGYFQAVSCQFVTKMDVFTIASLLEDEEEEAVMLLKGFVREDPLMLK